MVLEELENHKCQCIERPPEDDPGPCIHPIEATYIGEGNPEGTTMSDEATKFHDTKNAAWDNEVAQSLESSSYFDSLTSNDSRAALLQDDTDSAITDKPTILDIPYIQVVYEHNFHDLTALASDQYYRVRCNTMMGLLESPAYIDSVNCPTPDHRRLARACRNAVLTLSQEIVPKKSTTDIPHGPPQYDDRTRQVVDDEDDQGDFNSIGDHMKNLIFLGVTVFLMATAIVSLKNLQSSLNHNDGIGLYSISAGYVSFTIFSIFTPFIIQRFRPKRCLVLGLLPQLLYVVANLYPTFQILVSVSFLQGIGNAILWNAVSTYVTYLARSYALQNDDRTVHVASKYFGILFFFYQLSMVVGNLISSVVLMLGRADVPLVHDTNVTLHTLPSFKSNTTKPPSDTFSVTTSHSCGSRYCHSDNSALSNMTVHDETKYTLMGIFGLCVAFSVMVASYLLSGLKPYGTTYASCSVVCKQFISVLRCTCDRRFLMLFLAFMYSSVQNGFVTGDVTKAFVTCPLGIHMVGYTMICFGVCGGLSSYFSGCLNKHVGHISLLTAAAFLNLIILLVMSLWEPSDNEVIVYFVLIGCWGLGDGIWISQVSSLISEVFPDCLEEAFAAQRVVQGLGGALWFGMASSICMMTKIALMVGLCLLAIGLYILQQVLVKWRQPVQENGKQTTV